VDLGKKLSVLGNCRVFGLGILQKSVDELEHQIKQHKDFEDNLQVGMGNPYNIKLMTLLKRTRNPTLKFLILVFDRSIINSIK
jgi:hypothetical protein